MWTQQEGVFSHIIWEMQKHRQSPLIGASLHHNLVRNGRLLLSVECSNTPQNLNRAAWAQNQTHTASPRTPDDVNPISLLGQYKKHPLNSTCTYPHPSDWPDPLMGTNCHPRTPSLHLPMDLVAWKGTSPATTDL